MHKIYKVDKDNGGNKIKDFGILKAKIYISLDPPRVPDTKPAYVRGTRYLSISQYKLGSAVEHTQKYRGFELW
jgi:hypothetical protein